MRSLFIFALALIAFATTTTLAQAPDTAYTRTVIYPEYVSAVTAGPSGEIITAGATYGRATWRKWDEAGSCVDSNLTIGHDFNGSVTDVWAIALCADGSADYVLYGRAWDYQEPGVPLLLFAARVSSGGDVRWHRSYACLAEPLIGGASPIVPRQDGSVILFCTGMSPVYRAGALAVDVDGEPLWCNWYPIYGNGSSHRGNCIAGMADGGAIISGSNILAEDTCTIRIDAQGAIVWANLTQFSRSVTLHPDTVLCTVQYGPTLHTFKMTGSGDTVQTQTRLNRSCLKLIAEPSGGWSMLGSDSSGFDWLGRFNADGTMLWSNHYPIDITGGTALGHADYAFISISNRTVMKTESGPRYAPEQLTVMPLNGGLVFGWPDAEWRFYHLRSSLSSDGPFDTWEGTTATHVFWRSLDPVAPQKYYVVVGSDDPGH